MKIKNMMDPPRTRGRRKHKYNANPRRVDGIYFDSTREAEYYVELKKMQEAGVISHFHRQVIFDLAGVKYKCDFLIFYPDGTYRYLEVKGFETKAFKRNMKQLKTLYPAVEIEVRK